MPAPKSFEISVYPDHRLGDVYMPAALESHVISGEAEAIAAAVLLIRKHGLSVDFLPSVQSARDIPVGSSVGLNDRDGFHVNGRVEIKRIS